MHVPSLPGRRRTLPAILFVCLGWLSPLATSHAESPRVDPRFVLTPQTAPLEDPPPNQARLYVVREQYLRLRALPYETVYLDGKPLCLLPPQTWNAVLLEPGEHRISGIGDSGPFRLRCEPGRSYLVRLRERLDEVDQRTVDLIQDDPALVSELVSHRVMFAAPTAAGLAYLARRIRHLDEYGGANQLDEPLAALRLQNMLCERPLDQVNLRTDFGEHEGRLSIDTISVRYVRRFRIPTSFTSWEWVGDSLDIKPQDIVWVRFGGTRFTGQSPWVTFLVRTPTESQMVSFADLRPTHSVETYNRIFVALRDLMEWSRAREPRAQGDARPRGQR